MIGAARKYRPTQEQVIANNNHVMVRVPDHPNRNRNNQVPYAHLVMELHLGRYLNIEEIVHHIDLNPLNNDLDNLQLMTLSEHVTLHNNLKERDTNGRFIRTN